MKEVMFFCLAKKKILGVFYWNNERKYCQCIMGTIKTGIVSVIGTIRISFGSI